MSDMDYFSGAVLSQASYADFDFDAGYTVAKFRSHLVSQGFSESEADRIVSEWRVVDQKPNTVTGFSGTLFERIDESGAGTGEFYLAVRGTEPSIINPADLISDLLLSHYGFTPQSADLEGYYQNLVDDGTISADQNLTVVGHSLGGFLAQVFAANHSDIVGQTYTYNAPGLGGVTAEVLDSLGLVESDINTEAVDNFYAYPGVELTSNLGVMLGASKPVFIESGSSLDNHDIGRIKDALGMYSLFQSVDSSLSIDSITDILKIGATETYSALDYALSSLGEFFGKTYSPWYYDQGGVSSGVL